MSNANAPYAALITHDNVRYIMDLLNKPRHDGNDLGAYEGFYIIHRPLGYGYTEIFYADDFDRIYEFVAGKWWDDKDVFQKIQPRVIDPFD